MAKTATRGVELEPIDRLEEKLRLLVAMVERLKAEQARRGRREPAAVARARRAARRASASSETLATELSTLKEERDVIRTRVGEMLEQLEALNL